MSAVHQAILYASLVFLGLSLVVPGLMDTLGPTTGSKWLIAVNVDAKAHLRGLNGMMIAIGAIALWACWDLPNARSLVEALGAVLVFVAAARIYSMVVDGFPNLTGKLYLGVEAALGAIFLAWPPPIVA
jgi:uncharacterized protein YjeT (DUF2065 family)